MSFTSMLGWAIKRLFGAFKQTFLPNKKDLIGSIILTVPLYFIFGLSLIFLLPLIIVGVFIVFILRRLWMAFILFWTIRVMKKNAEKDIARIKRLFGGK